MNKKMLIFLICIFLFMMIGCKKEIPTGATYIANVTYTLYEILGNNLIEMSQHNLIWETGYDDKCRHKAELPAQIGEVELNKSYYYTMEFNTIQNHILCGGFLDSDGYFNTYPEQTSYYSVQKKPNNVTIEVS